jgi:hypothetical protein
MGLNFIMDITFASLIFASRTIPTDFGLVAAAIAELEVCYSSL